MPTFIFQFLDGTGSDLNEVEQDFETVDLTNIEARTVLGEMARAGLPENPSNMISVEIFDAQKTPILELRLTAMPIMLDGDPENKANLERMIHAHRRYVSLRADRLRGGDRS